MYTTVLCLRCGDPGEGILKCCSPCVVFCVFGMQISYFGRSGYLFPNMGSQSLAGLGWVLVVGSSDQGYFSGMALGDPVRCTLHPLLPAPRPAGDLVGLIAQDPR